MTATISGCEWTDPLAHIPGRIFLDTCTLNFILDNGEAIFDGGSIPVTAPPRVQADIEALRCLFRTGQRASWQLVVSLFSYGEVIATREPARRKVLESWFFEVWHYWREAVQRQLELPSLKEAEDIRVRILASGLLDGLPDLPDRILLGDAIAYRSDCFCTRDWTSVLKLRDRLPSLPIRILTPTEWWKRVSPHAALW